MGALEKGDTLIKFLKREYKDRWVTLSQVRGRIPRGGSYAREVFERAARVGLIERKVERVPITYYRIDPPPEPEKFIKEVCRSFLENFVEDVVRLKQSKG